MLFTNLQGIDKGSNHTKNEHKRGELQIFGHSKREGSFLSILRQRQNTHFVIGSSLHIVTNTILYTSLQFFQVGSSRKKKKIPSFTKPRVFSSIQGSSMAMEGQTFIQSVDEALAIGHLVLYFFYQLYFLNLILSNLKKITVCNCLLNLIHFHDLISFSSQKVVLV